VTWNPVGVKYYGIIFSPKEVAHAVRANPWFGGVLADKRESGRIFPPDGEPDVVEFRDDDEGYRAWLAEHPGGFVLNCHRKPTANHLVIHRATCRSLSGAQVQGRHSTDEYIKVCAETVRNIDRWTNACVGSPGRTCDHCEP
jgi:hypothetical protein